MTFTLRLVVLLFAEIVVEPGSIAPLFLIHLRRGHEGEGIGYRADLDGKHSIVKQRLPALQEILPRECIPIKHPRDCQIHSLEVHGHGRVKGDEREMLRPIPPFADMRQALERSLFLTHDCDGWGNEAWHARGAVERRRRGATEYDEVYPQGDRPRTLKVGCADHPESGWTLLVVQIHISD